MKRKPHSVMRFFLFCAAILLLFCGAVSLILLKNGTDFASLWILIAAVVCFALLFSAAVTCLYKPFHDFLMSCIKMGNHELEKLDDSKDAELNEAAAALNDLAEKSQQYRRALSSSERRYQVVTALSDDTIFEYNISDHTMYDSTDWDRISDGRQFLKGTVERGIVHPEDAAIFMEFFESLIKGRPSSMNREIRLRLTPGSDEYCWVQCQGTTIFSEDGLPLKVIGKRTNIDRQKREAELLRVKAMRDPLTGLSNKKTTETLITDILENTTDSLHALFLFDIDDFKAVNDNLGHLFGDAVLSDISTKISSLFRSSDIVGRVGGDEFAVFMRDIPDCYFVEKKANEMIEVFRRTYTGRTMNYKVSGSVGISLFPSHGSTFTELMDNADKALYSAKNHGKDCYEFYGSDMAASQYRDVELAEEAQPQRSFRENIISYIFEILYGTDDIENAVQMILDIVGRYYNVSRAYVFENNEDNTYCDNTFEWCNTGIQPERGRLQHVSYGDLGDYFVNFNDEHIFYCEDINKVTPSLYGILAPQGIHSMLQSLIMDGNNACGYVGFDECREMRRWTKDEIKTLTFISKILSIFLLKHRAQCKKEHTLQNLYCILDAQDLMIYVVDPSDYHLLFLNNKTKDMLPELHKGDSCYKIFMKRDSPCDSCPIRAMKQDGTTVCSREFYNPNYKRWLHSMFCSIPWTDDSQAFMVSCFDISKYKS